MEQEKINIISAIIIPKKGTSGFDETRDSLLKDLENITPEQAKKVDQEIYNAEQNYAQKREAELGAFIERYCNGFKNNVQGISNIDGMINKFKNLMNKGCLIITEDEEGGRHCKLDGLNHEIGILNLGTYPNSNNWEISKNTSNKTDFINDYTYETNLDGIRRLGASDGPIEEYYHGRRIADSNEIKEILKKLKSEYGDVIINTGRTNEGYHDEDIAFFMLIMQCYGEFILKDNKVLKCYDTFRGFKECKSLTTGQILIIRNK